MFTDDEKVAVRRYCGYGVLGVTPDPSFGYRFTTQYGQLEYRMNHLSTVEESVVRDKYLANLTTLEDAILTTSDNLDTDQAAVWYHNKNEQRDRENLFRSWRLKLCGFMGLPPGEYLDNPSNARIVV